MSSRSVDTVVLYASLNILGLSRRVEVKAKFKLNSKWHEPEHDLIGSSNIHLVFS